MLIRRSLPALLFCLLLGGGLGAGAYCAAQFNWWPTAAMFCLPAACVGHGIALALGLLLLGDLGLLAVRRTQLAQRVQAGEGVPLPKWVEEGLRDCGQRLGTRFTFALAKKIYGENAHWWARCQDDRWITFAVLGSLPTAAGLLAAWWLLRAPPVAYPALWVGLPPALVGLGETAVVWLLTIANQLGWRRLFFQWEAFAVKREEQRRAGEVPLPKADPPESPPEAVPVVPPAESGPLDSNRPQSAGPLRESPLRKRPTS